MTKPYTVRLEDEDGPEVEKMAKNLDRDSSYVIRFLVHAALEHARVNPVASHDPIWPHAKQVSTQ